MSKPSETAVILTRVVGAVVVLLVLSALLAANLVTTRLPIVTSYGFYDRATTFAGWPLVYWRGSRHDPQVLEADDPQIGGFVPPLAITKITDWISPLAIFFNVLCASIVIAGVFAAARRFDSVLLVGPKWKDFGAAILAACLLSVCIYIQRGQEMDVAELLSPDLSRPRLANLQWYSEWIFVPLSIGIVCGFLYCVQLVVAGWRMLAGRL